MHFVDFLRCKPFLVCCLGWSGKTKRRNGLRFQLGKEQSKGRGCSIFPYLLCLFISYFLSQTDLLLIQKRSCSLANSKGENTSYSWNQCFKADFCNARDVQINLQKLWGREKHCAIIARCLSLVIVYNHLLVLNQSAWMWCLALCYFLSLQHGIKK